MLTSWSMDLRCNGAQTVLKTVRMSASYMAQKLMRAGVDLQRYSSRLFMLTLRSCAIRILRSCRRIFAKRCPTAGTYKLFRRVVFPLLCDQPFVAKPGAQGTQPNPRKRYGHQAPQPRQQIDVYTRRSKDGLSGRQSDIY